VVTFSDAFPSKYLKASDLEDGPAVATVKLAELEQIKGFDGKAQAKVVVYFAKKFKPLVLNRTNFESIMDIAGDETDEWPGTKIELFVVPVTFNGKTQPGIRVRKPRAEKAATKAAAAEDETSDADMDDSLPPFV
jgi:hypothetical protein